MKIGIITWFQGDNYGTNLQAIALQRYLREQGYDVELLNFVVAVNDGKKRKQSFIKRILKQPENYAWRYFGRKYKNQIDEKIALIYATVAKYCCFTKKIEDESSYIQVCNSFDLLICGSDQIWNPNWYHRFFYADYPEIKTRKISYAPSLGVNSIQNEKQSLIKRSLSTFESVSVREENGAELLKDLSPVEPIVVLDPTFLLDKSEWNLIASKKRILEGPYVLSMFLTDNLMHWHAAKEFSRRKNMKHVVIPYCGLSYAQGDVLCANAGIEDLLALIRDAEYVLTDSFHITVFSLIFNRQFFVFRRFLDDNFTSQNARVENLLKNLGLSKRLLPFKAFHITEFDSIDYAKVQKVLSTEICQSKIYLQNAIKGKNK